MPRMPEIRYFKSRKAFYTQYQGHQFPLAKGPDDRPNGPTYLAAWEEFKRIMQEGENTNAKDAMPIGHLCRLYLSNTEHEVTKSTQTRRNTRLRPFIKDVGDIKIRDLLPADVTRFMESMRRTRVQILPGKGKRLVSWNDSTCKDFLRTLHAALNWGIAHEIITSNPLKRLKRGRVRSRGAESIITPEQHAQILADCRSPAMCDLLTALEHTGARPGELLAAKAENWNEVEGAIIYLADDRRSKDGFRHKSASHKDRVIYFTGDVLEMVRRRVRKHPHGRIFCNNQGRPYYADSILYHFRKLRKKLGLPHLSPYSYRHTFATNWLLSGKSIDILAELLGNSAETIRLHYAHLCRDRSAIRRQLAEFKNGGISPQPPEEPGASAS